MVGLFSFFGFAEGLSQTNSDSLSTTLEVRTPSPERLLAISLDESYHYQEAEAELGLWQRIVMWLKDKIGDWITSEYVSLFLKITAGIAFALVLFLFLNQLSKGELKSALMRRKDRTILNFGSSIVLEPDSKLDELIAQALEKKNYGLAVRYLYQKSISLLKEAELIHWKADKTNHDFLYELGNHPSASYFDRLTYFYEYVDYGDFAIDEVRFSAIEKVFENFKNTLSKK